MAASLACGCRRTESHRIRSTANDILYDVAVSCGAKSFVHGTIAPLTESGYHGSFEIGENRAIVVRWRDAEGPEGREYSRTVQISESPWGKEVIFVLDGTNVIVVLNVP